jgi:hypothetical protein
MNKVRAMSGRPRVLSFLIGTLALLLATGGKASAETCLLSPNWTIGFDGAVDGAGTVTLYGGPAYQAVYPVQHPVLSGTIHNVDAGRVSVALSLFDSGGTVIGNAALESPQVDANTRPFAVEETSWLPGTTSNFTLDARAMLEAHFPGIDLSTVSGVLVFLVTGQGADGGGTTAQFSNLCLTDVPQYTVAPLYDPNRAVKSGAVVQLKLQLFDAGGANVSSPSLVVSASGLVQKDTQPDGTLTGAGSANADSNFQYDATLQGYLFRLKTTGLARGTWCLTFTVNSQSDPSYQLLFNVR